MKGIFEVHHHKLFPDIFTIKYDLDERRCFRPPQGNLKPVLHMTLNKIYYRHVPVFLFRPRTKSSGKQTMPIFPRFLNLHGNAMSNYKL
jgi:hypothetical protein